MFASTPTGRKKKMITIEQMFDEKFSAIEVRVDAVTLSSAITGDRSKSIAFVKELAILARDEYFWLDEAKSMSAYGATGWQVGALKYLQCRDKRSLKTLWNIVGITGEKSREFYDTVLSYDEEYKVTRLDIAIDIAFPSPRKNHADVIFNSLKDKGQSSCKLIKGDTDTLYYGSRESPKMGRLYDKSSSYNAENGSVWRFELELKQDFAQSVHILLKDSKSIQKAMLDSSLKVWRAWNVPIPIGGDTVIMPKIHATVSTDYGKLEWLMSISGAIRKLAKKYPSQVYDALGLEQLAMAVASEKVIKVGDIDIGY